TQVYFYITVTAQGESTVVKFFFLGPLIPGFIGFDKFLIRENGPCLIRVRGDALVVRDNGGLPIRRLDKCRKLYHEDVLLHILLRRIVKMIIGRKKLILT